MINISAPQIGKEEIAAVTKVLQSGHLAQGQKVAEFEEKFAKYIGVKRTVAVSSGTAALHLALVALGIGKGDEVITTPFSFIASANCLLYTGAKPVFVDITERDFAINPDLIEAKITARTKAVLPVHLYGLSCDMKSVLKIAKKHKLLVIEDTCQTHGAKYNGKMAGSMGKVGCFSFYATKNMTSGEGGAITTNDDKLADTLCILRNQGQKSRYEYASLGFNYRMTDISAAICLEQLKKLTKFNSKRLKNASYYLSNLNGIKGLELPRVFSDRTHTFHQFTIRVTNEYKLSRNELAEELKKHGIYTSIYYPDIIPNQVPYSLGKKKEKLPIASQLANEVLSLPVHPGLNSSDLAFVVKNIKRLS